MDDKKGYIDGHHRHIAELKIELGRANNVITKR